MYLCFKNGDYFGGEPVEKINFLIIRSQLFFYGLRNEKKGFGMNELLGIAAGIIIAAFIIVPGLKEIAREMMDRLKSWWANIQNEFFPM